MNCSEAEIMITAHVDGSTDMLQNHWVRRHLRSCTACATQHRELIALSAEIRAEVPRFAAPAALRERVMATLDATPGSVRTGSRPTARSARPGGVWGWIQGGGAAGQAVAERWQWLSRGAVAGCAATMLAWVIGTTAVNWHTSQDLAVEAVTSHVRATLGNQLIQVASSSQHTVKPWLSARLDYSPPVQDLAQEGFSLTGGRIDYLDRHPVATLVYRFREHTIDVFVRPESGHTPSGMKRSLRGFNVITANGSGMDWVGVSDVSPDVLAALMQRVSAEIPATE